MELKFTQKTHRSVPLTNALFLFLILAALTLAILFIPAVIKDHAAKRSAQNREGLRAEEHSQAIHAMYLYAQRWRELGDNQPVPEDVYAIWKKQLSATIP